MKFCAVRKRCSTSLQRRPKQYTDAVKLRTAHHENNNAAGSFKQHYEVYEGKEASMLSFYNL